MHSKNKNQEEPNNVVTRACNKIPGFKQLYNRLEKKIVVSGKSNSTLNNYGRHMAHVALHFNCIPTQLDKEQIEEYLFYLKKELSPSDSYFKFTVYGLRFLFRLEGLDDRIIQLPEISRSNKLPTVLSREEIKVLLKVPTLLKHRILLALIYGCGLRCMEVRQLEIKDVDFDRGMLHIRQGKGRKDRYVPLGKLLSKGIKDYLNNEKPHKWLFNGKDHHQEFSQRGVQWVLGEAVKKTKIKKDVSVHTLRHSYATHLLEDGLDIVTIKELLGHERIETTMIYLHVARSGRQSAFSPLDNLYNLR
jgi:integrase/recombinase XerD